jgi:hypothetical protein
MASQPMVLKLKPVQTKKIVAAPSPVTFEPVSKRTSTKYDDNKIAERIPIEELKSGKYELPIWAEGLFDATPEGMPRRRRRLGHLSNEQKMLRRKLKNRVAAQNARDKKKTESENLKLENEKLLRLVHKLQTENLQREVILVTYPFFDRKIHICGPCSRSMDLYCGLKPITYLNFRMN